MQWPEVTDGTASAEEDGWAVEEGTSKGHVFVLVIERSVVNDAAQAEFILFSLHFALPWCISEAEIGRVYRVSETPRRVALASC